MATRQPFAGPPTTVPPEGGRVSIKSEVEDDYSRFAVSDTGPGIPTQYQQKIFDRYFQKPGNLVRGSVLGLAIAKQIVTQHGGRIGVESSEGHGSTFVFTIPTGPTVASTL